MYSDRISVFKNFQSEPKTIPLGQWLKVCKEGSRFTEQVLQYRRSGKEYLKTSLPFATVSAIFKDGRKLENVVNRTGWIALDIDAKDNPHLTNAEHIRDEVAKIKNVAFTGLSTGARGVWALVKVSKPDRQAEHFEALQADFKTLGIILDSTKGKNPNDARFYSFDPGAIIKESFTVYKKLSLNESKDFSGMNTRALENNITQLEKTSYAETAFSNELEILSNTAPGNRNNQLFKSSASLAELVAGGMLNEYEVKEAIRETAFSIGLKSHEIDATLNSGFNTGIKNPRYPESKQHYPLRANLSKRTDKPLKRKYESQISTPYGINPYTGEIFDKRGYPASWDNL